MPYAAFMEKTGPPCPACSAEDPRPIAYGFPTIPTFEAAARGEVALGGCLIGGEMPMWECRACGARYTHVRKIVRHRFDGDPGV